MAKAIPYIPIAAGRLLGVGRAPSKPWFARGWLVLGPRPKVDPFPCASLTSRIRPTVAYGVIAPSGAIAVQQGLLTADELAMLELIGWQGDAEKVGREMGLLK